MARKAVTGLYLVSRLQDELDWAIARAGEITDEESGTTDLAPPIDVFETAQSVVIVLEAPGLAAGDLEIEATGNRLAIRGRRPARRSRGGRVRFHCVERNRGDFQRTVELIQSLDTHRARAQLARGLLRIEIPKISERRFRTQRIEIEHQSE